MSEREADLAASLDAWFRDALRALQSVVRPTASSDELRRAATLGIVGSCARRLVHASADDPALYEDVMLVLCGACLYLRVTPDARAWRAALQALRDAHGTEAASAGRVYPTLGKPSKLFKHLLDGALVHAGVTDQATILDRANRDRALGLAVNWGLRFLLAYAAERETRLPSDVARALRIAPATSAMAG